MRVSLFDYHLPAELIAQEPRPRGSSRLFVLDRKSGNLEHRRFAELPGLLAPGDLLVRNDVRVRWSRLYGADRENRPVGIFLLARIGDDPARWTALARPGRRAKASRRISFGPDLAAVVERVLDDGRRVVTFDRPVDERLLESIGHVPLPPYIRRPAGAPDRAADRAGYQTVFAREPLAVAAPTAGLHFTEQTFEELSRRGIRVADLTLAVGAGTFKPVRSEDVEEHALDPEDVLVPATTADAIAETRARRGRVVAVGTTVTRALEAAARRDRGRPREDLRFSTGLFITPGFEFRAVDALLTNFHLPRSSLLMLVCAFAGRENVLGAYEEAIRERYLFYSFGDAMLIV